MDDGGILINRPDAVTLAQNAGVESHRGSISWRVIEPTQGTYNFDYYDDVWNRIHAAGFAPVMFISDNPDWVANTHCGPIDTNDPAKMAAFSAFITKLVQRYPGIERWALYNEPDYSNYALYGGTGGGCFGDHITNDLNANGVNDRADYARMLAAAWKATHQANPNAQLAMGAVAYDAFDPTTSPAWYGGSTGFFNYYFLPELFAYMQAHPLPNGEKYMDLMMFNFYDSFSPKWQQRSPRKGLLAKADVLQNLMAEYGLSFPMFVGETGVDSVWTGEQQQANCLIMTMTRGKAFGLRGMIWWTFQDLPARNWYYGVVNPDFAPKPSYYAFQTIARELKGYAFDKTLSGISGFNYVEAYQFINGSHTKVVVWSDAIAQTRGGPPCALFRENRGASFGPRVSRLDIVNTAGAASVLLDNGVGDVDSRVGIIKLNVGSEPLFIQPSP